jgi:hypothetical protein
MLKKNLLFLLACFCITTIAFADHHITRGPDVGEIYFVGPTSTGEGIYHSTDFGETAVCVDSISEVISICADKTPGCLYRIRIPDALYLSNNYGYHGSWVYKNNGITHDINSGLKDGWIFDNIEAYSNDYGSHFYENLLNGFFGSLIDSELGNRDSVGYAIVYKYSVYDSLYLLATYNNFENLEIKHKLNLSQTTNIVLSRGYEYGELYLYKTSAFEEEKELLYSNDYGVSWDLINEFNCPNLPITSIVGGRQPGELYMVVPYIQLGYEIAHIYIYHSLDYGETFNVYHPFSHGPEPYVANFEASPFSGAAPLTIQFTDLSTGEDINYWEWDFDNDGEIDSYEQYPEYTYQDTGYYSVSLTINSMNTATRYNYIHVTGPNVIDEEGDHPEIILNNTPNPFHSETVISYSIPSNIREAEIEIYNIKGQLVKILPAFPNGVSGTRELVWDGKDDKGKELGTGIYFCKLSIEKTYIIKKLMLIR